MSAESAYPTAPATSAPIASLLGGRYRLDRLIGRGSMGQVHRAWDIRLGRRVAIKLLSPEQSEDSDVARLRAGGRHLAATEHPNLVTLFDVSDEPDVPYLVMELVEGESLAERVRREGPLAAREVASIVAGIAAGLSALHGAGIVHRDVSPANILLGLDGRPRLADLGLAHDIQDHCRPTDGMIQGTLRYLAPELLDGGFATPASDVYGLAAVTYAALLGRPPAVATNIATLRHAHREPPIRPSLLRPGLHPDIDAVLLAALGPAVGRPSAYHLAVAVAAALRGSDDLPFAPCAQSRTTREPLLSRASTSAIGGPVRRAALALVGGAALLGLGAMSIAAVDGPLGQPRGGAPLVDPVAVTEPADRLLLGTALTAPVMPGLDAQIADTATVRGGARLAAGTTSLVHVAQVTIRVIAAAEKTDHRAHERDDRAGRRAASSRDD